MPKTRKILISLLSIICTIFITSNIGVAKDSAHLNAKFNLNEVKTGDTIELLVGNSEMEVATFIGSISYDSNMLEVVNKSEAVLERSDGNKIGISAQVEKNNGVIGIISIGTSPNKYNAQKQLVKITFKAKKVGKTDIYLSESSDGPSGINVDNILAASINIIEGTISDEGETAVEKEQEEKAIKEIKIITPPSQTDYKAGESFNSLGMVVEVIYEDGTSEVITDYQIDQILVDENTKQITISYGDKTVTQDITVKRRNSNFVLVLIIVLISLGIITAIIILLMKKYNIKRLYEIKFVKSLKDYIENIFRIILKK